MSAVLYGIRLADKWREPVPPEADCYAPVEVVYCRESKSLVLCFNQNDWPPECYSNYVHFNLMILEPLCRFLDAERGSTVTDFDGNVSMAVRQWYTSFTDGDILQVPVS